MPDRNDRESSSRGVNNDFPCFEDALAELEAIVHELEEGQLGLGDALSRYEQGVKRLKHCYQLLQDAEQKIELLTGVTAEGMPITQPLNEKAEPLEESAGRRRARRAASPAKGTPKIPPPMSIRGEAEDDDMDGE